jgi:hypothetical protein
MLIYTTAFGVFPGDLQEPASALEFDGQTHFFALTGFDWV